MFGRSYLTFENYKYKQMNKLFTFLICLISIPGFSQNKINLQYKFQNNDKYIVTTNIFSKSTQNLGGSPEEISRNQQINYNITFRKDSLNQNDNISLNFNKITNIYNQSDYKEFSSSDSSNTELSDFFNYYLSKTLHIQLSVFGKIKRLYTLDKLFPDSSETLQKSFFKEIEQEVIENLPVNIVFPQKSIQIGETWNDTDTSFLGIFNFYDKSYTLDSLSEKEYFITGKANFSSNKNNLILMKNVYISYNVTGNTLTSYVLDRNTCVVKKGKTTQSGNGNVSMKYTKKSDPAYSWKMTVNNVIIQTTKRYTNE